MNVAGCLEQLSRHDATIRKSNTPAPTCWICYETEQSKSNIIVRECACRGESNGYVHVDCLVKLAIAKADNKHQEGIDDENPFTQCITCKQEFRKASLSYHYLAAGCFKAFVLSSLATHAYLVGNTSAAIERSEECISLTRGQAKESDMLLATLLIRSGNLELELELGNTERGFEQFSESVNIMTVVYGRDHMKVVQFAPWSALRQHSERLT